MAITAKMYGKAVLSLAEGRANLSSDTVKAMLCTSAYTPNQDTHQFRSDVTNEITGTGYTAGGLTLAGVALTYDATTNTVKFDADDVVWAGASFTARYAVFYDDTPATNATKPLLSYVDFGQDFTSTNGPFTLSLDVAGIATWTVA